MPFQSGNKLAVINMGFTIIRQVKKGEFLEAYIQQ